MAPHLSSSGRNGPSGGRRRQSPTESTQKEADYLEWLSKNRVPVIVKMVDNQEVQGWIEYYDRDIIRLTRHQDSNLFIYKERIKYISEEGQKTSRRR
jgi:host factor-I protein